MSVDGAFSHWLHFYMEVEPRVTSAQGFSVSEDSASQFSGILIQ